MVEQVARDERLLDTAPLEDVVTDIRRRTLVSVPPRPLSSTNRLEPDTFIVSYSGQSPELAQRVANRLTQVFVETHSKMRETRAEDTSAFLERQLANSRERLSAAETRLREAKASFQGRLPEQALSNLQSVSELRQRQDTDRQALATERERLAVIDEQIEGLKQDSQAAATAAMRRGAASAWPASNSSWPRRACSTPRGIPRCSGSRAIWHGRRPRSGGTKAGRGRHHHGGRSGDADAGR